MWRSSLQRQKQWSAVLAIAAVIVVAIGANTPAQGRAWLHSHGQLHPWFHLGIFGRIAWLLTRTVQHRVTQTLLLVGVIAFGVATEFVEFRYDHAYFEYGDVALDGIGALIGGGVAAVLQRRSRSRAEGRWE